MKEPISKAEYNFFKFWFKSSYKIAFWRQILVPNKRYAAVLVGWYIPLYNAIKGNEIHLLL